MEFCFGNLGTPQLMRPNERSRVECSCSGFRTGASAVALLPWCTSRWGPRSRLRWFRPWCFLSYQSTRPARGSVEKVALLANFGVVLEKPCVAGCSSPTCCALVKSGWLLRPMRLLAKSVSLVHILLSGTGSIRGMVVSSLSLDRRSIIALWTDDFYPICIANAIATYDTRQPHKCNFSRNKTCPHGRENRTVHI
jgi:hypothetical protein